MTEFYDRLPIWDLGARGIIINVKKPSKGLEPPEMAVFAFLPLRTGSATDRKLYGNQVVD
ncbi:MAG: hypothetical protein Q7R60_03890 [bacterium]|nr:hypothetical protein [bacterium]